MALASRSFVEMYYKDCKIASTDKVFQNLTTHSYFFLPLKTITKAYQ